MGGLVTMAIQACFGASGTVFRLFYAAGASSTQMSACLLGGSAIIWIRTFFLMPKLWVAKNQDAQNLSELTPLKKSSSQDSLNKTGVMWGDLSKSLTSLVFISFLYWFSVANSLITFCVSVLNRWAAWVGDEDLLVNIFGVLLALTVIFGPVGGLMIDGVAKCLKKNENMNEKSRRVVGSIVVILINIACGLAVCALNCFQTNTAAISSIVTFQGHRIYTYGMAAAFLQSAFPQEQFGSLMGFARLIIGLTSLINLPLISMIGDVVTFRHIFAGYGIVVLTSIILPIVALYEVFKVKKSPENS